MKEEVTSLMELIFKNPDGDWVYEFITIEGWLIFSIPSLAVLFAGGNIFGATLFSLPLILIILLQRFVPI